MSLFSIPNKTAAHIKIQHASGFISAVLSDSLFRMQNRRSWSRYPNLLQSRAQAFSRARPGKSGCLRAHLTSGRSLFRQAERRFRYSSDTDRAPASGTGVRQPGEAATNENCQWNPSPVQTEPCSCFPEDTRAVSYWMRRRADAGGRPRRRPCPRARRSRLTIRVFNQLSS